MLVADARTSTLELIAERVRALVERTELAAEGRVTIDPFSQG